MEDKYANLIDYPSIVCEEVLYPFYGLLMLLMSQWEKLRTRDKNLLLVKYLEKSDIQKAYY